MGESCKVRRSHLFLILLGGLLLTMTGVCFADMGNPAGLLILLPIFLAHELSVSIFCIALITGFILFVTSWFKAGEKASRKEYLKGDLYIFSILVIGVITSGFVIGFVLVCIAIKRANKLFRERISETGLYVNAKDGRKLLYYLSGLIVCSFAILAANSFAPAFMEKIKDAKEDLSQGILYSSMEDYLYWHPVERKVLFAVLIGWAIYMVLNLVYLILAKGKSVKFIIDGLSVYVYIFAAYCFDYYGGTWLLVMAAWRAVTVIAAESKYKPERIPKKSVGERMTEVEKTDQWIEKLQEEAEKGPTHREKEVSSDTQEETE